MGLASALASDFSVSLSPFLLLSSTSLSFPRSSSSSKRTAEDRVGSAPLPVKRGEKASLTFPTNGSRGGFRLSNCSTKRELYSSPSEEESHGAGCANFWVPPFLRSRSTRGG